MSLTKDRVNEIENISKEVLENVYSKTSLITPPIKLTKLFAIYNIYFYISTFNFNDVAGQLIKTEDENQIFVNRFDPNTRKRFTIAHEIGHLVLHPHKISDIYRRDKDYYINLSIQEQNEETEANYFASFLLIPTQSLVYTLKLTKNIEELATIFNVSTTAMEIRLNKFNDVKYA
jgi:Zn-dependent peptidase ImmA (M78 family)